MSAKLYADPDVHVLSDRAFRAWVYAMAWSADFETDGVYRFAGKPTKAIEELVAQGRLAPGEDGGYLLVGWEKWQRTRAEMEALSEQRRQAGSKGAAKRWQTASKPVADLDLDSDLDPETSTTRPSDETLKQISDRQAYFRDRLSERHGKALSFAAVQKLNNQFGTRAVLTAMEYLYEAPPPELDSIYAYLKTVASMKAVSA